MSKNSMTDRDRPDECGLAEPNLKNDTKDGHSLILLRDYQQELIDEIHRQFDSGKNSTMAFAPPGTGKNLIAGYIAKEWIANNLKVMIVNHRESLFDQTKNRFIEYGIDASLTAYIKSGYPEPEGHEKVIIGTIQTIGRREYPSDIDLIIFDECHTTSCYKASQNLILHYKKLSEAKSSPTKFLHLTATPCRSDPQKLFDNIDAVVRGPGVKQLTDRGYLAPVRYFAFDGDQTNLSCQELQYNQQIVDTYREVCPNKQGISYAEKVEQSKLLTELFNKVGIVCAHVDASTPGKKRREIYQKFKDGEIQIISNVGILIEGFDEPSIEAVILASRIRSKSSYTQKCGRGSRLSPETGKQDYRVLDFGGNFQRFGHIDREFEILLCPQPKPPERSITKHCPKCHARASIFAQLCPYCEYQFSKADRTQLDSELTGQLQEMVEDRTKKQTENSQPQLLTEPTPKLPTYQIGRKLIPWLSILLIILAFYQLLN